MSELPEDVDVYEADGVIYIEVDDVRAFVSYNRLRGEFAVYADERFLLYAERKGLRVNALRELTPGAGITIEDVKLRDGILDAREILKNGEPFVGQPGKDGRDGVDGKDSTAPGPPGKDSTAPGPPGRDGRDGVDGKDGESIVGPKGAQGEPGDGHPPVTIGPDGEHTLDGQELSGTDAAPSQKGHLQLAGDLAGTAEKPRVKGLTDAKGRSLKIGELEDGEILRRQGNRIVSGPLEVMGFVGPEGPQGPAGEDGAGMAVVSKLPATGDDGDMVYLTTDQHPYVYQV